MKAFTKLSVALSLVFISARTQAADFNWKNPVSSSAAIGDNWTPTGPPGNSDTANFNLSSAGYIVDVGTRKVGQLRISNDTLTLAGSSFTAIEPASPAIQLGNATGDVANLSLNANLLLAGNQIWIGAQSGSQATVTINHATLATVTNSPFTSPTEIVVGAGGIGTLALKSGSIQDNGKTTVGRDAGSQGAITVDSSSSQFTTQTGLTIGQAGVGSLALTNRANSIIQGVLTVGHDAGSNGSVSVASDSFAYATGSAVIGGSGQGSLTVTNGGDAWYAGPFVIGQNAGSHGTVTVDGLPTSQTTLIDNSVNANFPFTVGAGGQGSLTLDHSAFAVIHGPITLGRDKGASGSVTVANKSILTGVLNVPPGVDANITVGVDGTGMLSVKSQGQVQTRASVVIAQNAGSSGTINVEGGSLAANGIEIGGGGTGLLSISSGGTAQSIASPIENHAGGTITIQGGSLFAPQIDNAGVLTNNGTIFGAVSNLPGGVMSGSGAITGALTQNGGTLSPGNSPGTLSAGALNLQGGAIEFETNSVSGSAGGPKGWDLITTTGAASLSGAIKFDLVSLTPLNQAGSVVDFDPLHTYQWNFLTAGGGITGFNPANFTIDTTDFSNPFGGQFFVSQIGNSLALNYAVPEPSTIVLAAMGMAALLATRLTHNKRGKRQG